MNQHLIKQYGFYVYYHSSFQKQLLHMLVLRSTIAFKIPSLLPTEQKELYFYDQLLIHEAHHIYKRIQTISHNNTYPSSHWWWDLGKI